MKNKPLEDGCSLWRYEINPVNTIQMGKLPGGGKRAAPGNEGGREDKDTRTRILRQEIMANVVLMQNSPNPVTQAIRARVMQLERDTAELEQDEIFEPLYENMGEKQMLKLQEKFVASGRNTTHTYTAIAKGIFAQQFQMIEDTKKGDGPHGEDAERLHSVFDGVAVQQRCGRLELGGLSEGYDENGDGEVARGRCPR